MLFRPVEATQMSEHVSSQVRRLVREGKLRPGMKLPSERELAQQLSVGRSSVREAVKALASQGILDVRHGRGIFVVSDLVDEGSLIPWLFAYRDDVLDLLEVREVLETRAASLAAARRTPNEAEELLSMVDEMNRALLEGTGSELHLMDLHFHARVAELSGNDVLIKLCRSVNQVMSDRKAVFAIPGRAENSLREHQQIAHAIRRGDPEGAGAAVATHMENVKAAIRQLSPEVADRLHKGEGSD